MAGELPYCVPGATEVSLAFAEGPKWFLSYVVSGLPRALRYLHLDSDLPHNLYPWTDTIRIIEHVEERLSESYTVTSKVPRGVDVAEWSLEALP